MSYDLYLYPRDVTAVADFKHYFQGRAHYRLSDDGSTAGYENPATGVYFEFSFWPAASEAEIAADLEKFPDLAEDANYARHRRRGYMHFNINYMRPHVFGIEAAPEVAAAVEAFDCEIQDDQLDGMGTGPFTREGFVRGWNAGNRFGYAVLLRQGEAPGSPEEVFAAAARQGLLVAPSQRIADVWTWNFARENVQRALTAKGLDVFVPSVMWGQDIGGADAGAITFAVWGGGIATAIPSEASHVLVGLPTAPQGLLARVGRWRRKAEPQFLLVERARLLGVAPMQRVVLKGRDLSYCAMDAEAFDSAFCDVLGKGRPAADAKSLVRLVRSDSVLDEDVLETLLERS